MRPVSKYRSMPFKSHKAPREAGQEAGGRLESRGAQQATLCPRPPISRNPVVLANPLRPPATPLLGVIWRQLPSPAQPAPLSALTTASG